MRGRGWRLSSACSRSRPCRRPSRRRTTATSSCCVRGGRAIRGKARQALGEEPFAPLPGESYIKGCLRTYAEYLGLDGQVYVDEFNSRYVAPAEVQSIRARRTAQARRQRRVQGGVLVA